MKRTKAEKKARKAKFAARKTVEAHGDIEQRAVAVMDSLQREVIELRGIREAFRHMLFGAFMARGLGEEPKLSDAVLQSRPEMFKGHEEAPWMALSQQS